MILNFSRIVVVMTLAVLAVAITVQGQQSSPEPSVRPHVLQIRLSNEAITFPFQGAVGLFCTGTLPFAQGL